MSKTKGIGYQPNDKCFPVMSYVYCLDLICMWHEFVCKKKNNTIIPASKTQNPTHKSTN
mgnify:CR=1 FL=1